MASANFSTAGAVSVKNTKGEISMEKVKVQRYVSGRKPNFGDERHTSSDESDDELNETIARRQEAIDVVSFLPNIAGVKIEPDDVKPFTEDAIRSDRRLRRLIQRDDGEASTSRRPIAESEFLVLGDERRRPRREAADSSDDEQAEDNVERRHALLKQLKAEEEEELFAKDDAAESESDDEESEYEEYTDSEEDELAPTRLKPVFTRKDQRGTVLELEKEAEKERQRELKAKKEQEERRKYALKIIEDENKKEEREKDENDDAMMEASIAAVLTDDESEETAYELWKLRELKRIKRERDERDALMKEKLEIEKLRNMTEEERQAEIEKNPKLVTNKADKGKYSFMQKYYHRGVFYLDEENEVFKRDFAEPTLEDHFDKTILPKVMQVKNFGRSGRTKYTHLVDQDTTAFDSPWVAETSQSKKFETTQAGGSKPIFERPSTSKRRKT